MQLSLWLKPPHPPPPPPSPLSLLQLHVELIQLNLRWKGDGGRYAESASFCQSSHESRRCHLNHSAFCNQTGYGGALLCAGVSHEKKMVWMFSGSRSQRHIWSRYDCFCYILQTADPFATKLSQVVHVSCENIWLLCSRSNSQQRFKISFDVCPGDIIWTIESFEPNLRWLMHCYEPGCHAERFALAIIRVKVTVRAFKC